MSEAREESEWTWDAYLEWESRQPVRHELVDGQVHAMGGGTAEHDAIGNNLRGELRDRLRGKRCRPHGPDLKVRAGGDGRYPDALVDCGPRVPGALVAQEPAAVFEVLSKSTHWIDQSLKLRDYEATESIKYYVLISQEEPLVQVYRRDELGRFGVRSAVVLEGMDASIDLPDFGVSIPFGALYEGVQFPEGSGFSRRLLAARGRTRRGGVDAPR